MNKIEKALVGVYCKMHKGFNNLMQDEKGDTNFIYFRHRNYCCWCIYGI